MKQIITVRHRFYAMLQESIALAQAAVSRTVPTENRGLFDILHATVFVFVDASCSHMMPKLVNRFEPTP